MTSRIMRKGGRVHVTLVILSLRKFQVTMNLLNLHDSSHSKSRACNKSKSQHIPELSNLPSSQSTRYANKEVAFQMLTCLQGHLMSDIELQY